VIIFNLGGVEKALTVNGILAFFAVLNNVKLVKSHIAIVRLNSKGLGTTIIECSHWNE